MHAIERRGVPMLDEVEDLFGARANPLPPKVETSLDAQDVSESIKRQDGNRYASAEREH